MEDTASRDTGGVAAADLAGQQVGGDIAQALSELTLKSHAQAQHHHQSSVADLEDGQDLRDKSDQQQGTEEDLVRKSWPADEQSKDQHADDDSNRAYPGDAPTKPQICFDFTKGMCMRGDKCKFSHDLATIVQFNSKEKGICFDYLRSSCQRGLLCRFSHDLSTIAQQCQVFNGIATKGRTNAICYDFVKGVCQRGSDCRYSHDLSLIARTARGGATTVRGGETCYDYLRGRCSRGVNCKYSHNISFLGAPASGMLSDGGSSVPDTSSGGSSCGGAIQQGAALLLQQGSGFPGPSMQPSMPDGEESQVAHDLQPCGRSLSGQLWPRHSADYSAQQAAAAGMPRAAPVYGNHLPTPGPMPGQAQMQRSFPAHLPMAPPPHGGMAYMHQLQQAAVAASMQQQGLRNMRRNSADCANSSLAAATAHQAAAIYQRLHGPPPAPVHPLMAQVCSADLGGWPGPASMPFHAQHGHARHAPNYASGAGSEPSSMVESYPVPAPNSYGLAGAAAAANDANLAGLPSSLLPLLKEIWNK